MKIKMRVRMMAMLQAELFMRGVRKALQVRAQAGIGSADSLCVYDLAECLGVEVRLVALANMEGMYCQAARPHILVSALRPAGRQVYTCAHELGHHVFRHGNRIDEMVPDRAPKALRDPDEFLAECFAGILLMPKTAVNSAFHRRAWDPNQCTPIQILEIAGCFGVGYQTLIHHMSRALDILPMQLAETLERLSVAKVRGQVLGEPCPHDLFIVNRSWMSRPADLQIDDLIILPSGSQYEGSCLIEDRQEPNRLVVRGAMQGKGKVSAADGSWSVAVRVSRRDYHGRNIFRHLEEDDAD